MRVIATAVIEAKLEVLDINLIDVEEALFFLDVPPIVDNRAQHRTSPLTAWFVAPALYERLLFIAGIYDAANEVFIVKTAREANETDLARWHNGKW